MKYKVKQFDSLFKIPLKNGLTKPKRIRGEGIKFINMGELFATDRIYDIPTDRVPVTNNEKENALLEQHDLLFARQSLVLSGVGKCSIIKQINEDTTYDSHLIRVRLNKEITIPEFYYYYFSSPQGKWYIQSIASQVAAAGIRGSDLKKLEVPLPPLPTQHRIAAILTSLDDKIENNRKTAEKLEEIAQAIFKRWFVDFEFPDKDGKPYKSSGGQMVYCDELGKEIPEGWECCRIDDMCDISSSKRIFSREYVEEGIPFYRGKEVIQKSKGNSVSTELYILPERYNEIKRKFDVPIKGDILLTSVGTLGISYMIGDEKIYFKDGNLTWFKKYSKEYYRNFIYLFLKSKVGQRALDEIVIGSTQKALTIASLKQICIAVSDIEVESFDDKIQSMLVEIKRIYSEIQNLGSIRDSLLPKLMSGEIEVKNVECGK